MKALTLIEPWASLIIDGRKRIETRGWSTQFRGTFAVHAGKKVDRAACAQFGYDPAKLVLGAVLGTIELYDCFQFTEGTLFGSVPISDTEREMGNFALGRFGFRLRNEWRFTTAIPVRGMLAFWEWKDVHYSKGEL